MNPNDKIIRKIFLGHFSTFIAHYRAFTKKFESKLKLKNN